VSILQSTQIWLSIFGIIQNPWRFGRGVNNESYSKSSIVSIEIFPSFHKLPTYFSYDENRFQDLFKNLKILPLGPACQLRCQCPLPLISHTRRRARHMAQGAGLKATIVSQLLACFCHPLLTTSPSKLLLCPPLLLPFGARHHRSVYPSSSDQWRSMTNVERYGSNAKQ
jgi:hypothetical protein